MDLFVRKHEKKINGALGCFDRMLFHGYLPIQSAWAMAELLKQNQISYRGLKGFLIDSANRVNQYAKTMAAKHGRPFPYLTAYTRKEELARKIAEKEGIQRGLVCIYSAVEACRTFCFRFEKGRRWVRPTRRKCLFIYFYFMDRQFGLIHVKLQTWFPMHLLKMYDKAGSVLRLEMVINNPEEFKVRKKVIRKRRRLMEWVSMRKGVAYLFRYQEVSRQANSRYLEALAVVDDPTPAMQQLDDITTPKKTAAGRGARGFNPLSRNDIQLFKASPMQTYAAALNLHHICEILPIILRNKAQKSAES